MADRGGRQIFERFVAALAKGDFVELEDLLHPEYVEYFPQSGERLRGFAAFRAMLERFPGGLRADVGLAGAKPVVLGDEERWVLTPGYTVVPLAGPGTYTGTVRVRYPDDSIWHVVALFELRDGRIWKRTTYFAPEFEPPEWRRDLVDVLPRDSGSDE
jgi:hypothetical protein